MKVFLRLSAIIWWTQLLQRHKHATLNDTKSRHFGFSFPVEFYLIYNIKNNHRFILCEGSRATDHTKYFFNYIICM